MEKLSRDLINKIKKIQVKKSKGNKIILKDDLQGTK